MRVVALLAGFILLFFVLLDAFQTSFCPVGRSAAGASRASSRRGWSAGQARGPDGSQAGGAAEPGKKSDIWTVVSGLRSPQLLADRLTNYVSTQSTAAHLSRHGEDAEP